MPFADPVHNIEQFGVRDGERIADLGAGTGAYTIPLCQKVGDTGRVYAVEVQKDLLAAIKSRAEELHLTNLEVIWGDIEVLGGTKIADHIIDGVVLANVMFQVDDKPGVLAEVRRILKHDGRVLFVDWKDSFGGLGPQPEYVFRADKAKELFEAHGFTLRQTVETGTQHYGFICTLAT